MEKDILSGLIEVEKEIQQRLEDEEKRSKQFIYKTKKELEKELLAEENNLKESLTRAVKDARLNAEKKASEILKNTHAVSERLESLSDEILKEIIFRHIINMLPEE